MRARAGDPPRTMAQKILAGRCADPTLSRDAALVKVAPIAVTRATLRASAAAREAGLQTTTAGAALVAHHDAGPRPPPAATVAARAGGGSDGARAGLPA